jgi:hypothetical protein
VFKFAINPENISIGMMIKGDKATAASGDYIPLDTM